MKSKRKRKRAIGKEWQWALPSSPWFKVICPGAGSAAEIDELDDFEIIDLVRGHMKKEVAYLLRRYPARLGLLEDATNNLMVRIAEKDPLAKWSPKKGTRRKLYKAVARMVVRETVRDAGVFEFESLEFEPRDTRFARAEDLAEQSELLELVNGWITKQSNDRREAVRKKYSSAVVVEYPKRRGTGMEYTNRSRGLDELRERARELGLLS